MSTKPEVTVCPPQKQYRNLKEMPEEERKALRDSILENTDSYFKTCRVSKEKAVVWNSWGNDI